MSVCDPCTKVLPVLYCSDDVWVGDWPAGAGVALQVWWMNTANGLIGNEAVTSGTGGKVSIEFPNKMQGNSYELWMNASIAQMMVKSQFKLPSTATLVDCILVSFERVTDLTVAESKVSAA